MHDRLADGGKMVSIMSNHWLTSSNKKETAFREFLWKAGADVLEIEAGAFKESGTSISACIIVLDKTKEVEPPKEKSSKTKKNTTEDTYKSVDQSLKEFEKYFESLSGKYSAGEIFIDFLDYALHAMKWWKQDRDFSYFQKKYSEMYPKFMEMFIACSTASDHGGKGFRDALGDLFMGLVSHGRNGQLFTPEPICDMMVDATAPQLKDGESVLDPACGSGRMLLAAAKRNRNAFFYGCDIDTACCKMAVINLLINSIQGEIALMDSLSMKYTQSWKVSIRNVNGIFLDVYRITENKKESALWHKHMNSFQKSAPIIQQKDAEVLSPQSSKEKEEKKKKEIDIQLSLWD